MKFCIWSYFVVIFWDVCHSDLFIQMEYFVNLQCQIIIFICPSIMIKLNWLIIHILGIGQCLFLFGNVHTSAQYVKNNIFPTHPTLPNFSTMLATQLFFVGLMGKYQLSYTFSKSAQTSPGKIYYICVGEYVKVKKNVIKNYCRH
jgi:hypothetical protein